MKNPVRRLNVECADVRKQMSHHYDVIKKNLLFSYTTLGAFEGAVLQTSDGQ